MIVFGVEYMEMDYAKVNSVLKRHFYKGIIRK